MDKVTSTVRWADVSDDEFQFGAHQGDEQMRSSCVSDHLPRHGDVDRVFCVTLPADFQTATIGELNVKVVVLMMQGPNGMDLRPGNNTTLQSGFSVYFVCEISDEADVREIFQKLVPHSLQEARCVPSDDSLLGKLVHAGRQGRCNGFTTVRPVFDTFCFPCHCAGHSIGVIRDKFGIHCVAHAQEDGTMMWWPAMHEIVHQGDQGLVLSQLIHDDLHTTISTLQMEKVSCLQHERSFHRILRHHAVGLRKTRICRFGAERCRNKHFCSFAHSASELR